MSTNNIISSFSGYFTKINDLSQKYLLDASVDKINDLYDNYIKLTNLPISKVTTLIMDANYNLDFDIFHSICDQQNKFANIIDYYKFINSNIPLFNDNITLINYYSNSEDIINFNISTIKVYLS
jgi:hypothetical protein